MNQSAVHPKQLDAIREVVNIGAGHAATALSTMTNLTVMISVPRILWVPEREESAEQDQRRVVMISVPVIGKASGTAERASLVIGRDTALQMVGLLLRRPPNPDADLGTLEKSTLQELGNIVCASYVGVLGNFLGESVMIGTPEMAEGTHDELVPEMEGGLVIETDFTLLNSTFEGVFILSHSEISFANLLRALGLSEL